MITFKGKKYHGKENIAKIEKNGERQKLIQGVLTFT